MASMMKDKNRAITLVLRAIAFCATLAAAIVMATSHERVRLFGVSTVVEVKYSDSPAFMYFVIANAIVSVYGLLVMFLPRKSKLWKLVVALDVVFTVLLASTVSAAWAIAYVGKKGNSVAGWVPICGQVDRLCHQVAGALAAGFIGLIFYVFLVLYAIHTVLNPLLVH